MRRFIIAAVAALGVLLAQPAQLAVAAPEPGGSRWETPVVCVQDRSTTDYWPVRESVERLNGVHPTMAYDVTPYLVFAYTTGSCPDAFTQRITVWHTDYCQHGHTWYGATSVTTSGIYITSATVMINDCYADPARPMLWRFGLLLHELTHALGPGHTTHCDSVMGPNCTHDGYPTHWDSERLRTWYDADPVSITGGKTKVKKRLGLRARTRTYYDYRRP